MHTLTRAISVGALGLVICGGLGAGLGACQSRSEKYCFSSHPDHPKRWMSACGELCEKHNAKACRKEAKIGSKFCFKKGNREVCEWGCNYSTIGKNVYCKTLKALDASKKHKKRHRHGKHR